MSLLRQLLEAYIRVEKDPDNLTVADGEAGRGIYFSLSRYPSMIDYYRRGSNDNRIVSASPKTGAHILDLSSGVTNTNLIQFMQRELERLERTIQGYVKPKLNRNNYQRFGRLIQDFIQKYHPDTDAYIVNHQADGTTLPKGKQLIVVDDSAFDFQNI